MGMKPRYLFALNSHLRTALKAGIQDRHRNVPALRWGGGAVKVIESIKDPVVIKQILARLLFGTHGMATLPKSIKATALLVGINVPIPHPP